MRLKQSNFEEFITRLLDAVGDSRFIFCPDAFSFSKLPGGHPPRVVLVHRSESVRAPRDCEVSVVAISLINWCKTTFACTLHTFPDDPSGEFVAFIWLGGQHVLPHSPELSDFIAKFEEEFAKARESRTIAPCSSE